MRWLFSILIVTAVAAILIIILQKWRPDWLNTILASLQTPGGTATEANQIQDAAAMVRTLQEHERQLITGDEELFRKIEALIAIPQANSAGTSPTGLDAIMIAARHMQILGDEAITDAQKQLSIIQNYTKLSGEASSRFRGVAEQNREFAKKEHYPEHRESYFELALFWDERADAAETTSTTIAPILRKAKESLKYVTATHVLLSRQIEQSESWGNDQPMSDQGQYTVLSRYTEAFSQFRTALHTFHDHLADAALPDADLELLPSPQTSTLQTTSEPMTVLPNHSLSITTVPSAQEPAL